MSLSVDQFGKALVASGLFSADEVKAFWASLPAGSRPKDGQTFAALLVKEGKLTQFQADQLGVADGLQYETLADVTQDFSGILAGIKSENVNAWKQPAALPESSAKLQRVTRMPTNSVDALVRRAEAIQQTADRADGRLHLSPATAKKLGVQDGTEVVVAQNGSEATVLLQIDEHVHRSLRQSRPRRQGTPDLLPRRRREHRQRDARKSLQFSERSKNGVVLHGVVISHQLVLIDAVRCSLTCCASAAGPAEARACATESTARGPRHMAPTAASAG